MSKLVHASAQKPKHNCSRCHKHKRRVRVYRKKSGRLYCLCDQCERHAGIVSQLEAR
jgi:hypothetical protein